jgi:hypothetical protein
MVVSMPVEEYQVMDHHQNHYRHAREYHIDSRSKYHTRNQWASRKMVHTGSVEYHV